MENEIKSLYVENKFFHRSRGVFLTCEAESFSFRDDPSLFLSSGGKKKKNLSPPFFYLFLVILAGPYLGILNFYRSGGLKIPYPIKFECSQD